MLTRKRHAEAIAERNQCLPDFRLEQNDDRDTDVEESVAQHKLERREILFDGEPIEENESGDACGHGSGTSAAQEFQDCIHEQKDKDDVRDIARLNDASQILGVWQ
jgi:hypothetical protein